MMLVLESLAASSTLKTWFPSTRLHMIVHRGFACVALAAYPTGVVNRHSLTSRRTWKTNRVNRVNRRELHAIYIILQRNVMRIESDSLNGRPRITIGLPFVSFAHSLVARFSAHSIKGTQKKREFLANYCIARQRLIGWIEFLTAA